MSDSSRQKAVDAARELFMIKGKDGVRMQEIADSAGINKGLLHYYFKSKNALFIEVFSSEVSHLYSDINTILLGNHALDEKLSDIIDRYFVMLESRPKLPSFVMFEVNKDPAIIGQLTSKVNLAETIELLDQELKANRIPSDHEFALQVILNIISLCIFPFMMEPMGRHLAQKVGLSWEEMMSNRKKFLKHIIINSFKP
ncbi:MAG: TetR/AcrR family transcriptional regulator [Vicingaceae bacterium]